MPVSKGKKLLKKNLDETDSLESGDDGDISDMITEWRDDEQELMSLMDQDNYNGDYVMVKFSRKQRVSYYAGEIKEIDTESEEAQTMFLRWGDLHKGFVLTLLAKRKLPKPTTHGGTSRTAQKLSFPCDLSQKNILYVHPCILWSLLQFSKQLIK